MQRTPKTICCGCGACQQACPVRCVELKPDKKGFIYPNIDKRRCIKCGKCENVCPVLYTTSSFNHLQVYAAKNSDEDKRLKSSSGGIFSLIAEKVIADGGVVFGTKWNEEFEAIVDWTDSIEGIAAFRGSKYLQSVVGDNYKKAEEFLKRGKSVLFSGTPCQIKGLKTYLGKEYENLLTVEVICHGAPSPLVWKKYLNSIVHLHSGAGRDRVISSLKLPSVINGVSFRDKTNGWKKFSFRIDYSSADESAEQNSVFEPTKSSFIEPFDQNDYMRVFLSNLSLRPSCFNCKAKAGNSGADITIGDLWGVDKHNSELDDDKGTSLVITHNNNACVFFERIDISLEKVSDEYINNYNTSYLKSVDKPYTYEYFWWQFRRHGNDALTKKRRNHPTLFYRIYKRLKGLL